MGHSPTFTRHYRVAALPFHDAPGHFPAAKAVAEAETAERELRLRLSQGEVPDVALVAPERSTTCHPTLDQHLAGVFAWTPDCDQSTLAATWIHSPHAVALLTADKHEPDPYSDYYADRGSVYVASGTLERLYLSSWLLPVARQLADVYGVDVVVDGEPDIPAPDVHAAPAVVTPGALSPAGVADVRSYFDEHRTEARQAGVPGRRDVGRPYLAPPGPVVGFIGECLGRIGDHFGLPVTRWDTAIVQYQPGDSFAEHTDVFPGLANSLDRTVSLSLLLSQQGVDYTGGAFKVGNDVVALDSGDVVGFTAQTPHSVTKVESGERLVLIAFGEVAR